MAQLPAIQINPNNALVDFSPINNAIDQNRQDAFRNNALQMQNRELGMRQQQHDYQMQRDRKNDAHMQVERAGKMAFAIQQMPDSDPAKAAAWQRYLKSYGDGDHTPEEMDFRTGPKLAAAAAGQFLDPRVNTMKDLEIEKTRAEISKLNRAPVGGELPSNVREWEYFNRMGPEDQQRYLAMKRAEKWLDTGTQFVKPSQLNPSSAPLATVQKDVAGQKAQQEIGEAQGKAVMDMPRQQDNADTALKTIEAIRSHPGKKWGVGAVGVLPGIPGTAQNGFVNLVDQAKGQVFLQAFSSLRGGGAITEAEGAKATQALSRLDRSQSEKDFDAALGDLEAVINSGLARAKAATGGRQQAAPATLPDPLGIR